VETTKPRVGWIFMDFGICILDTFSGRQIGLLTVMLYFMAYVNFYPCLPTFVLKESVEIWYWRLPSRTVEQLSFEKFCTVKAILYLTAQVIFSPQFLHFFFSFWIKFGIGGVHKNY
jgi:hypothetical protein